MELKTLTTEAVWDQIEVSRVLLPELFSSSILLSAVVISEVISFSGSARNASLRTWSAFGRVEIIFYVRN